jgi:hypothetical protein
MTQTAAALIPKPKPPLSEPSALNSHSQKRIDKKFKQNLAKFN